jgi:formyl-CoA transferase
MGAQSTSGAPAPCGIYPTKPFGYNDYVYIFCSRANPEHWDRLLKVIGREDLIGDPRYDTQAARAEREPEIDAMVGEWTKKRDKYEAMALLGRAGIPTGAVRDTMELQNDPDFETRGIMQVMQHPQCGPFKMPAWPVRFGGRAAPVKPAPLLGQHAAEVLGEWLGMAEGDVAGLKREKVIG